MSLKSIDSSIIRSLAHSGLKTFGSLLDLLDLYEINNQSGLHDPHMRQLFARSIQAFSQAIQDLRLIAICDEISQDGLKPVNIRVLLEQRVSTSSGDNIHLSINDGIFDVMGYPDLIGAALGNLVWFSKRFWSTEINVHLTTSGGAGQKWFHLKWDFGKSLIFNQDFSKCEPFFPLFPKESLTLDKSTGLVLYAIKRVAELHGGSFEAFANADGVSVIWTGPPTA